MKEIQIRLSGTGGQGLQLSAKMMAEALIQEGRQIA
ncbi:MAG: pyruvate ferredoxin oxidoreductase, partial [Candidatus Marinimicrobia bacterium]|nr:pyruvate ferredoxin oxidoreductase [Candidatus Neomarinimicrobiota bacterium]